MSSDLLEIKNVPTLEEFVKKERIQIVFCSVISSCQNLWENTMERRMPEDKGITNGNHIR